MMSNDEVTEVLSAGMRKFDRNAVVHGIPDDPVFILSLDGVPQEELDSVKVKILPASICLPYSGPIEEEKSIH